jgi:ABC-2 type transport system ATP-binding protein
VISQPGKEPGRDIATTLVRAGFGLHELRRVNATLEDVFLQLTTEEKNFDTEVDLAADNKGEAA